MVEDTNQDARPDTWHPIKRTLIIGYGNPDRGDDGVGWYILQMLAEEFQVSISNDTDIGIFSEERPLDFLFNLQLMPEMATEMVSYERLCFVDAHTGAIPENIHLERIESEFQNSPLTHHLTPQSLVSILEQLYQHTPEAIFVSVRGFNFRFEHALSPETKHLAEEAIKTISTWIKREELPFGID